LGALLIQKEVHLQ